MARKNNVMFPNNDYPGYLSDMPPGGLTVDTPDGVFTDPFGLGPYAVGEPKGRTHNQGAGTDKTGGVGNAAGRGKTVTLKGD